MFDADDEPTSIAFDGEAAPAGGAPTSRPEGAEMDAVVTSNRSRPSRWLAVVDEDADRWRGRRDITAGGGGRGRR